MGENPLNPMKRLLLQSLALAMTVALVPAAQAQRQRSVRVSAPSCSFSLSIAYADPVPDTGMVRGRIVVTPSPSSCTSWNAYSPVDWIVFESGAPANEAALTVLVNTSTVARTATVRIAGIDLPVTQLGKVDVPEVPIVDTGVVKNGTFNTDLANWGWQDRFPNGVGTVTWASGVDANGSAGSGSIRLRNTALEGPGIQSLQCVSVEPGLNYTYSFAIRLGPASAGLAVTSVFDLESTDCSGPYFVRFTQSYYGDASNSWQRKSNTFRVGFAARSLLVVLAGKTNTSAPFDVYFDDVSVKPE